MDKVLEDIINKRPQRLCHMCGKCCKVCTTSKSYEELLQDAENGEKNAIDFLSIFEPYKSIEEAEKVSKETVENIIKNQMLNENFDIEKITFYKCRYILENNLCGRYKDRPDVCKLFPYSPWAVIPPGCGYEGWLFMQREEKMKKIRKQKELLLDLETALNTVSDETERERIQEGINKIKSMIELFSKYGSKDW